ncbi:hypothetical protein RND71_022679 [Anisodus tanguticus]|uniref:RING-type domain-containing protein n=1 Tax=Anisodus tanguticus TaxID=243964 RepID=A0AAE1VD63_9SOLA|nr:hypothetical protein RND71_022679 [Anisodus tanguticus]
MDDFARRQASIKSVLTCGICKKLCKKVTIIEECCHRFCKKCITKKITEEKSHVCPVCNLDLGVAPLQKIRPDHQVQEIRDIFSDKRREYIERGLIKDNSKKGETKKLAHEDDNNNNNSANMLIDNPLPPAAAAVAKSSRRNEKSISSLVDTMPVDDQVTNQQNVSSIGRRRRGRKANKNATRFQDSSKFDNIEVNQIKVDQPGSSSIPILSGKATQNKQQVETTPYGAESSKNDIISKKNKSTEPLDGMNDLWEPLNTLVTKGVTLPNSNKSKSTEPVPNFTPLINLDDEDDDEDEEYVPSPKTREHKVSKTNVVQKEERRSNVVPAAEAAPSTSNNNNNDDKGKGKKGRCGRKKKETNNIPAAAAAGSNNNVAQVRVTQEAAATIGNILNQRVNPIWFTLVASDKQDVNMHVSYIKKYLAQKLSLQSEHGVDLHMLGIQLRPELPLHQLADLWLRAAEQQNSGIKKTKVGGSAKDFVMVLTYARNLKPQPN